MTTQEIVDRTATFVRDELYADTSGHDWWHVERVRRMAVRLGREEGADMHIVELAALLHDISDYKLNGGDEDAGPRVAYNWLTSQGEEQDTAAAVAGIVHSVSFKGAGVASTASTLEAMVVQDADRLDAIGAIGVARAFTYGGFAGEQMHDPASTPELHRSKEEYLRRTSTTINHFFEKLLVLSDRMNTKSARRVAAERHRFMEAFLAEFFAEWDARDLKD
jgi:uncharacterized protein